MSYSNPWLDSLDHVPQVRGVGTDQGLLLGAGVLALYVEHVLLEGDLDLGVVEVTVTEPFGPLTVTSASFMVTLTSLGTCTLSSKCPVTVMSSPQYTNASSLPPTPFSLASMCVITPSVVVSMSTPKSWAGR